MDVRKKRFHLSGLILVLCLVASCALATGDYAIPYDDPKTYVPALEEAIVAVYGEEETWPEALETRMQALRYYSGVGADGFDPPAVNMLAGFFDTNDTDLRNAFGSSFSWPYELHALTCAARAYATHKEAIELVSFQPEVTLPGPDDLTHADAVQAARAAIAEQYDLTTGEIEAIPAYGWFAAYGDEYVGTDSAYWYIVLGLNDQGFENYLAFVASPSGEVLRSERNDGNG